MDYSQIIKDTLSNEGIEYWTYGKNVSDDSINVNCPFCPSERGDEDPSNHCGIFTDTLIFHCWRCSKRGSFAYLLATLTHKSIKACESLIEDLGVTLGDDIVSQIRDIFASNFVDESRKGIVFQGLPEEFEPLHRDIDFPLIDCYMERRDLWMDTLIQHECGICRSGSYMNRLIIPVYQDGEIVAFQAADMTGRASLKYKNSNNDMDYLYRYDTIEDGGRMVITEGVLDAWRVDDDAVCTFGSSLTANQRDLIIRKNLNELVWVWDADAYWSARKESEYFAPFIPNIYVVHLPEHIKKNGKLKKADPDELGYDEVWKHINEEIYE